MGSINVQNVVRLLIVNPCAIQCLHSGLSSFEDESDATISATEDEHTLTAFGDLSLSQAEILGFVPNDIRHRNQLRLKERRKSAQYNQQIPGGKFWDPLTSSLISTPLKATEFFNRFRHTVRRDFQRAQAEAAQAEVRSHATHSGESSSSNSSDDKPGQSTIIVKDVRSVSEAPELVKEWRKLPLRPGIPKTKKTRSPRSSGTLLLLPAAFAFKPSDFKTCSQSGFCRRERALAARAQESPSSWHSPYSITPPEFLLLSPHQPGFTTSVHSSINPNVKFVLDVIIHEEGIVRVRMDEEDGPRKRHSEAA
ncbi:hypothetical protein BDR05DRAFT_1003280 [Suillus weaverae]|nr:hypothetical protein BDR05DRAFT_1003280 [Suillus weaverae]